VAFKAIDLSGEIQGGFVESLQLGLMLVHFHLVGLHFSQLLLENIDLLGDILIVLLNSARGKVLNAAFDALNPLFDVNGNFFV